MNIVKSQTLKASYPYQPRALEVRELPGGGLSAPPFRKRVRSVRRPIVAKSNFGPINDELGFEQGGISSSDLYILYNNEQLQTAQESGLGICIGDQEVAAVGQADDVVLLSHDVHFLANLLKLTLDYCKKHHVTLAP